MSSILVIKSLNIIIKRYFGVYSRSILPPMCIDSHVFGHHIQKHAAVRLVCDYRVPRNDCVQKGQSAVLAGVRDLVTLMCLSGRKGNWMILASGC